MLFMLFFRIFAFLNYLSFSLAPYEIRCKYDYFLPNCKEKIHFFLFFSLKWLFAGCPAKFSRPAVTKRGSVISRLDPASFHGAKPEVKGERRRNEGRTKG